MATMRRPRKMRTVKRYTIRPRAAELFRQMHELPNCSCKFGPMYWNIVECKSCDDWWKLHSELHDELNLSIFDEYPALDHATGGGLPYDKIAGGRVYQRSEPQVTAPAEWDRGCALFDALAAAAGIAGA